VKGKFIHDIHQHLIKQKIVPPVVDPLAVLALFMPETVEQGLNVNIKIMATGKRTAGMSLINYFSSF
jgi:inosine-uridine nucleoside N-ribohydrolase